MKKLGVFRILPLLLLLACSSVAYSMETISWEQLVPPFDQSKNPFLNLPQDQRSHFIRLWKIHKRQLAGKNSANQDFRANKYIAALEAGGVDVKAGISDMVEYVRLRKENERRLVEELNGKNVTLEGYLLPTEFNGDRIVEFLLVPEVGACVHTPVPPVNQLVYVKLPEGIANPGLFTPVRVGGLISTDTNNHSIPYSDGDSPAESGYSMLATRVERFAD
jgi:hypothetical protein